MAKPRVFISSTFYDLRQIRAELDSFILSLGYDPVRNEEGDIPYGKEQELEEYCYKEIENSDILISIIGGRFGTTSKRGTESSISQMELETALELRKQIYIFIEKSVLAEFETYMLNKDSETAIKYRYVDNVKIYQFIEKIKGLDTNNNIKGFETAGEITRYLKEQFAGLFQNFLASQKRELEISLINRLDRASQTLDKLVNYLSEENKDQAKEINKILTINHPLVESLKEVLKINYNFYIEGFDDLNNLLKTCGFKFDKENDLYSKVSGNYLWLRRTNKLNDTLKISTEIFDHDRRLIYFRRDEWRNNYVVLNDKYDEDDNEDYFPF